MSRGGHAKLLSAPSDAQNGSPSGFSDPADESSHGDFPELIGRYRRDRKLGRGGMGVVFRYRDSKLDRFVAVKSLVAKGQSTFDASQRDNLMREAKNLAALAHPNIGAIHDVIEHDGADYLLLEYVPGGTLAEEIRSGRLDLNRALSVALQIGQAIDAGHEAGIVHGDIKPGNIMITPSNVAKLLDYGLARRQVRVLRADEEPGTTASIDLSAMIVGEPARGTPGYMSPELLCGSPMHRSADIWAFGCVLFECLAGEAAFRGSTPQERIAATFNTQPHLDAIGNGTPPTVIELIKRCLSKVPDQRPRQMADVCAVLRSAIHPQADASSRSAIPSNVPAQVSSFVDRQGEIPKLLSLLERARLLTLIGPGGCGKTRLSQELARCALHEDSAPSIGSKRFDAIWFIELASLTSGDLVPRAIASIVCSAESLKNKADQTLMQTIIETVRDQRVLLVLDNCEHLVDGAAACAKELLSRCVNLRIIATSRAALHVVGGGEHAYHVPALSYPRGDSAEAATEFESVRLFTDRARQARSGFELTDRNSPSVTEICRRLEGIPLAIELAAARVVSMPVDDLAKRLFEVLDPRRVLETSIQWSVNLLSPAERTLLERLSVFRGGWTLEAAEAVCGDGETRAIDKKPVVELLTQLVDKSLVLYEEREDRARYHMLETVREFAEEQLASDGETQAVCVKHVRVFATLCRDADANLAGRDQEAWVQRLQQESDNLRKALDCAFALDQVAYVAMTRDLLRYWCSRGYAREGRRHVERALPIASVPSQQVQLLNAAGILASRQGDIAVAIECCQQALDIARREGDRARIAGVLTNLGIWALSQDNREASKRYHEESIEVYSGLGDSMGVAMARLNLGDVALADGRWSESKRLLHESIEVFKSVGDKARISAASHNLGVAYFKEGQNVEAGGHLAACLKIRGSLNDNHALVRSLEWMGMNCCAAGEYRIAARCFGVVDAYEARFHVARAAKDRLESMSSRSEVEKRLDAAVLAEERSAGWSLARESMLAVGRLLNESRFNVD